MARLLISEIPVVSIVVPIFGEQTLHYRILTIKLVSQKRKYNGDYRQS